MDSLNIIDLIPFGHENAVTREQLVIMTGLSDRKVRHLIEISCNCEHPILNLQDGRGYFRPRDDEKSFVRIYRNMIVSRNKKEFMKVRELDKYLQSNDIEKNQINLFDMDEVMM